MAAELVIRIDLDSTVPAYRQIVDALRALMVEGRLAAGDQLPTVRELALDLGVHHNTVAQAYRELAAEGWLDLRRRRGALVLQRKGPRPSAGAREEFDRHLRELVAKAHAGGLKPQTIIEILARTLSQMKESPS
jgi:DNA-binding transcriptional regulator YhcF (GntR family)